MGEVEVERSVVVVVVAAMEVGTVAVAVAMTVVAAVVEAGVGVGLGPERQAGIGVLVAEFGVGVVIVIEKEGEDSGRMSGGLEDSAVKMPPRQGRQREDSEYPGSSKSMACFRRHAVLEAFAGREGDASRGVVSFLVARVDAT